MELNIRYYRDILRYETDPAKRQMILRLLAEEEDKLAKLCSEEEN